MIDDEKLIERGGRRLTTTEIEGVRTILPSAPSALLEMLARHPLVGAHIHLTADADPSDFGVHMRWMAPAEMISEATKAYPGIVAVPLGYIPIGTCRIGSGDPYFYRARDGGIVRIPHDAAQIGDGSAALDESAVELVAPSVAALVAAASLDASEPDADEDET